MQNIQRFKTIAIARFKTALLPIAWAAASFCAQAQTPPAPDNAPSVAALRSVAQKALDTNPDVAAKWNAFRAAVKDTSAAHSGYLPRIDLSANARRTRSTVDGRTPETGTLNDQGAAVSISQTLWNGLSTTYDVERLDHTSKARYFELQDAIEQTTLEAVRAHYDVVRFRKLVSLAEDNYVQHRYAYDQIQSRVKAGVGRGVDLEQASARVALAESNLITENANLHDVTVRYLRIVGENPGALPPDLTPLTPVAVANSEQAASDGAISHHPAVNAAIETLRAVQSQLSLRKAVFQPTVEAQVRSGLGHNLDGALDQTRNTSAGVTLNWNLFNGGADQTRIRQSADLLNQAMDLRDKVCRDTRQTASIAFNDTLKLKDQINALSRNTLAIQKARDAYRQQFDIGQRSLLDLLNAENEVYTAQRSLSNAEHDLAIAYARSNAAASTLTSTLGVQPAPIEDAPDTSSWRAGDDAPGRCPPAEQLPVMTPTSELDKRVSALGLQNPHVLPANTNPPSATSIPAPPPLSQNPASGPYKKKKALNQPRED